MSDTLSIISAAFAKAILSQENRPIRLRWSQREAHLEELLLVQRVEISEALFEGMRGHLTCISIDPDLPLHELIGQPLGIEMVNDRGGLHHINGLITEARAGHADGALRVYQLTLRDALSVMDGRINTRIFRCKSVPEILHLLLREWRLRSPTLAHAFSFDLHRLNDRSYPSREITHQFNESDAHFIGRLCRREGITWYIATPQAADDPAGASGPVHTLVFCDQVAQLPQASTGSIRYHRDGATEVRDTISAWSRERVLTPGNVQRASWDYKMVRTNETMSRNVVDQGRTGNEMGLALTEWFIDAPHIGNDLSDQARLTDARMLAHEARAESFQASGTVRDLAVGHWFELQNHPDMRYQDASEREFIVTTLQQRGENNFPKDLQAHVQRLLPELPWHNGSPQGPTDLRYHNRFTCVRRTASVTPHYDPRLHLPVVHPITALVVGPAKEEVYCDEYGRIKVQLQGLQEQDHGQSAGTSGHVPDSAFVRVASTWAGAGYGHDAVPRVGMEVLLDFLGGDPDKMFVSGVLHNGSNRPARFSHASGLPANRFISGIKTREIGAERYNQLRMDDTPGQISAQLASEHQHSQVNLGHLTEPRLDGHGDDRGQGLEARTDGHGVMRGAKGILITAQSQDRGRGRMLERDALLETLQALQQIAQRLGQHAVEHHAEATDLARLDKLRQQLQAWDQHDETPRPDAPMVAIDAPAGVSMTSQEGMVLGAQDHIDVVSQTNTQLSAGRRLLMRAGGMLSAFAARHMKLIAGKGSIKMQAHEEHIEIAAARRIALSASEEIILAAPKISIRSRESTEINGGGSFSRWQGSLIEHGTSGEWRQQAGDHNILGPANCPPPELPPPPTYEELQHSSSLLVRLRTHARAGRVLALQPYTLFKQGKQVAQGVTDASGQLRIANHLPEDSDYAIELPNGYRFDLPVHETLDDIDSQLAASGFDPAMELERRGHTWPRGTTWGDLLKDVAAGKYNNGKPVQVRVLCWRENPSSIAVKNTPGYGTLDASQVKRIQHHERLSGKPYTADLNPEERRRHFNAMWYFNATSGAIPSLTFLVRSGDFSDAYSSLAQEKESPTSLTEKGTLALFPTAHQKTVLVDYDYQGGEHAVGYVMGLNSVTDYWDTKKHLFHDPRRGQSWEGGGDELPGLKPFQDYACRINGEVLINVSKNFVDAWNRVASGPQKIAREHDLHSPPAGLKIRAGKSRHRAQIVRTQIEEGDKTINRPQPSGRKAITISNFLPVINTN